MVHFQQFIYELISNQEQLSARAFYVIGPRWLPYLSFTKLNVLFGCEQYLHTCERSLYLLNQPSDVLLVMLTMAAHSVPREKKEDFFNWTRRLT